MCENVNVAWVIGGGTYSGSLESLQGTVDWFSCRSCSILFVINGAWMAVESK